MYKVKFCTLDDLNDIERIIDDKKTHSRQIFEAGHKQKIKDHFKERLTFENPFRKIVGLYNNDNKLKGFCSIFLWEVLPFWSISLWYRENSGESLGLNYYSNGYIDLLKFSTKYAHNLNRFESYAIWDEKSYKIFEKLWNIQPNLDHMHIVEYYYKKGDPIKYKLHSQLFGNIVTIPYNCYVAKTILKHEHRFQYINK